MIIALVIPKNKRTKEYPSNTERKLLRGKMIFSDKLTDKQKLLRIYL